MKHSISGLIKKSLVVAVTATLIACGGAEERKEKYLEKAISYLEQDNFDKARIEFKNVLQIDPKFAEAYYYMGLMDEKKNEPREAFGRYKKANELDPEDIRPKIKLAEIYAVIGTDEYFDKAAVFIKDILAKDPNNNKAKLIEQQINYKKGNEKEAISIIEKLVEADSQLENGINLLSMAYYADGKVDEAIAMMDKGIAANPDNFELRTKKVRILYKEERFGEAEKELIDIKNQDKTNFSSVISLSSFYAKREQLDKAEKVLRDSVQEAPNEVKRALTLVQFLVIQKGMGDAITELDRLIAEKPEEVQYKFALAKVHKSSNKIDEAKTLYKEIIANAPTDVDVVHGKNLLAEILIKEANIEGARSLLDEVLKEYPSNTDALILAGSIDLSEKNYEAVVNSYRTILKNEPDNAEVAKKMAQAHIALNEHELAESVLKKGTEVHRAKVGAFLNYAGYLYAYKTHADVKKLLERAQSVYKDNFDLQQMSLKLYSDNNDKAGIKRVLDDMASSHPNKADVFINRGQYYFALKQYDQAIVEFEKAIERSRNPEDLLKSIQKKTGVLLAKNDLKGAKSFLETRISVNSKDLLSMYVLGNVHMTQKEFSKAKKSYELAIEVNNQWPDPYISLAALHKHENNINKAISLLEDAVKLTDGNVLLSSTLASYFEMSKDFEKAASVYENILIKEPVNALALNNLAVILLDHMTAPGSEDKALGLAKKLNTSTNLAFKDTLGWAYAKSGDNANAVLLLREVVEKMPKIAEFRYHLGYALYHMGDKEAAKENLQVALSSGKDFAGKDNASSLLNSIK